MKERDFQAKFGRWIRENQENLEIKPAVYELKIEKGKSFAFDKVKEHQIKALLDAKHNGIYYKINDLPVYTGSKTRFSSLKPFDCFYLKGIRAYIVIGFYTPRKKIEAVFIDIDKFLEIREFYLNKGRKSIKKEDWKQSSNKFFKV
ncbi:MAG: hypothetical protein XE08_0353 [Parcubacteria bacterium 32_520]|nr:MAG: hypothetical protein XE08_0353 [Parcubacteria bacterium 32_520]